MLGYTSATMVPLYRLALLAAVAVIPQARIAYPDKQLTPGASVAVSRAELCSGGYLSRRQRRVSSALKRRVCDAYGILSKCPGPDYEIDHFVPRELGGSDNAANLWPQPIDQAKLKDRLEDTLRAAVCAGRIPLDAARGCIATDWYACWECWDESHCPMGKGLGRGK